jgi:hypothetical protein
LLGLLVGDNLFHDFGFVEKTQVTCFANFACVQLAIDVFAASCFFDSAESMVAIGAKTFGVVLGVRMLALSYLLHIFARLAFTFNFLGCLGHLKFLVRFRLIQISVESPL